MKKLLLFLSIICSITGQAQSDTTKWIRGFPITSYMVDLNDSVKVVQLLMPEGHIIKDKQLGLVRGVATETRADTATKGYGKCHLIKGDYYYFTIGNNNSGVPLKEGDLLYTFMDKTDIYYGQIPKIAAHFISLLDVYGNRFYDRYTVFLQWTQDDEMKAIDMMVKDIQFTGNYFLQNDTSKNKMIETGRFSGQRVLKVMASCKPDDVGDFIDYLIARPRLYAGKQWKMPEIFATWLVEGSPTVVRE
jgi:hypothetical protein